MDQVLWSNVPASISSKISQSRPLTPRDTAVLKEEKEKERESVSVPPTWIHTPFHTN